MNRQDGGDDQNIALIIFILVLLLVVGAGVFVADFLGIVTFYDMR